VSIRIRVVDGVMVALCAARSMPQTGDVYLDDAQHHALAVKFDLDTASMYPDYSSAYAGSLEARLIALEESNNPNRDEWDRTFGVDGRDPAASRCNVRLYRMRADGDCLRRHRGVPVNSAPRASSTPCRGAGFAVVHVRRNGQLRPRLVERAT